jgi:hypothetical protein
MTVTIITDPRPILWGIRQHKIQHLAELRHKYSHICGLACCADNGRHAELGALIVRTEARIAEITDLITDHACLPAH